MDFAARLDRCHHMFWSKKYTMWYNRIKYDKNINLTFVSPCIVIYFHSKTNQMHNTSNLFYFGTTTYVFQKVSPSIIGSLRLYIQHQVYVVQVVRLLASNLWHISGAAYTVLDSWWWMERPSKTCRLLFQNKINLRYCVSGWFYYGKIKYVVEMLVESVFISMVWCIVYILIHFSYFGLVFSWIE